MDDIQELYQQTILDHNKNPRNFGKLEEANRQAEGFNPLCGDHINIDLILNEDNDTIKEIHFNGHGCAISKASASIMTTMLKGKTKAEAEELFKTFQHLITAEKEEEIEAEALGKLAVFLGVREFPARVKCASLAWHTMKNAIENKYDVASTE